MSSKDEKQEEKGKESSSNPSSVIPEKQSILMKKGDYTVHILIEELKNLISIEENHLPSQ